ncbi:MAG: hypothetical protein PUC08_04275 [Bacteroidales bacterium]|nr:hypothetical protein [Bacteroidales bacterium]
MFFDFAIEIRRFLFDKVVDYHIFGLKEYNFHANHIALGLKSPKAISSGQSVSVAPSA